jgi:hypothetical protein
MSLIYGKLRQVCSEDRENVTGLCCRQNVQRISLIAFLVCLISVQSSLADFPMDVELEKFLLFSTLVLNLTT